MKNPQVYDGPEALVPTVRARPFGTRRAWAASKWGDLFETRAGMRLQMIFATSTSGSSGPAGRTTIVVLRRPDVPQSTTIGHRPACVSDVIVQRHVIRPPT